MNIKKPVKQGFKVLKPVRIDNVTHDVGAVVQLLPKQAVFLLSGGMIQAAESIETKK
jgi:hypothetical protein